MGLINSALEMVSLDVKMMVPPETLEPLFTLRAGCLLPVLSSGSALIYALLEVDHASWFKQHTGGLSS